MDARLRQTRDAQNRNYAKTNWINNFRFSSLRARALKIIDDSIVASRNLKRERPLLFDFVQWAATLVSLALYVWDIASDALLVQMFYNIGDQTNGNIVIVLMTAHYVALGMLLAYHKSSDVVKIIKHLFEDDPKRPFRRLYINWVLVPGGVIIFTLVCIAVSPLFDFLMLFLKATSLFLASLPIRRVIDDDTENFFVHYKTIRVPMECIFESLPMTAFQIYIWLSQNGAVFDTKQVSMTLAASAANLIQNTLQYYLAIRVSGLSVGEYLVLAARFEGSADMPLDWDHSLVQKYIQVGAGYNKLSRAQQMKVMQAAVTKPEFWITTNVLAGEKISGLQKKGKRRSEAPIKLAKETTEVKKKIVDEAALWLVLHKRMLLVLKAELPGKLLQVYSIGKEVAVHVDLEGVKKLPMSAPDDNGNDFRLPNIDVRNETEDYHQNIYDLLIHEDTKRFIVSISLVNCDLPVEFFYTRTTEDNEEYDIQQSYLYRILVGGPLEKLNLSSNDIGTKGVKTIVSALSTDTDECKLRNLILSEGRIPAAALQDLLKVSSNLVSLDVSSNPLHKVKDPLPLFHDATAPKDVPAEDPEIWAGLKKSGKLQELNLSGTFLSGVHFENLMDAMAKNTSVTHLDISNNPLGDDGADAIATNMITDNDTLKNLELRSCGITKLGIKYICESLKGKKQINSLDFSGNPLHDEGVGDIAKAICDHAFEVECIKIVNTSVSFVGLCNLVEALEKEESLICLDFSFNELKEVGDKHLGKLGERMRNVIKLNPELREFHLSQASMSVTDVRLMLEGVKGHQNLKLLDLSQNPLGNDGAQLMADLLSQNEKPHVDVLSGAFNSFSLISPVKINNVKDNKGVKLRKLCLSSTNISSDGFAELLAALAKDKSQLKELDVSNNFIGHIDENLFRSVVKDNASLLFLDLRGNNLSIEACTKLQNIYKDREEVLAQRGNWMSRVMSLGKRNYKETPRLLT